jgi:hypothetical protein
MAIDKLGKAVNIVKNMECYIHFLFDQKLISNKNMLESLADLKFLKEYLAEVANEILYKGTK